MKVNVDKNQKQKSKIYGKWAKKRAFSHGPISHFIAELPWIWCEFIGDFAFFPNWVMGDSVNTQIPKFGLPKQNLNLEI